MRTPPIRSGRIQRPSLPARRTQRRLSARRRYVFFVTIGRQRQYGFPSADSVDGAWTTHAGGTDLAVQIDELLTPNDADYIRSEISPASSGCRVKLTTLADPSSSIQHEIHWRIGKDFSGGPQVNMSVALRQGGGDTLGGGTEIATFSRNNVDALTTYVEQLNGTQADSITNYADLYLEFYATQV